MAADDKVVLGLTRAEDDAESVQSAGWSVGCDAVRLAGTAYPLWPGEIVAGILRPPPQGAVDACPARAS